MWKEFFAILLLLCLVAGAGMNTWCLGKMTGELLEYVDRSKDFTAQGDFGSAAREIIKASDRWREAGNYTRILLRQTEIDSATDAFYDLLRDLYAENSGAAEGSYEKLRAHIESIHEMESVSLGSIF